MAQTPTDPTGHRVGTAPGAFCRRTHVSPARDFLAADGIAGGIVRLHAAILADLAEFRDHDPGAGDYHCGPVPSHLRH